MHYGMCRVRCWHRRRVRRLYDALRTSLGGPTVTTNCVGCHLLRSHSLGHVSPHLWWRRRISCQYFKYRKVLIPIDMCEDSVRWLMQGCAKSQGMEFLEGPLLRPTSSCNVVSVP
eukprot:PhF_6_TR5093/c0_g1_i2/m.7164